MSTSYWYNTVLIWCCVHKNTHTNLSCAGCGQAGLPSQLLPARLSPQLSLSCMLLVSCSACGMTCACSACSACVQTAQCGAVHAVHVCVHADGAVQCVCVMVAAFQKATRWRCVCRSVLTSVVLRGCCGVCQCGMCHGVTWTYLFCIRLVQVS
jgi:hypothetical protein